MSPMEFRPPVELSGRYVRLVPLQLSHTAGLARAADDPEIWRYIHYGPCRTLETMSQLVSTLLQRQATGSDLPFTVESLPSGTPIGMTRFLGIERKDASVEVGGTWYVAGARRTPVNTESKRLLLGHAFDVEGAHRVQLRTDLRNDRSQRAIERLGATREGVLREHIRMPDGYLRSSVVYSILADEWPAVRARLDAFLQWPWTGAIPDPGRSVGASA